MVASEKVCRLQMIDLNEAWLYHLTFATEQELGIRTKTFLGSSLQRPKTGGEAEGLQYFSRVDVLLVSSLWHPTNPTKPIFHHVLSVKIQ